MQTNQPEKKTDKERLFARIRNEKVTLFIGSGFSYGAGAPTANAITEAIKRDCAEIQKTELKDVAEEYVQRNDDNKNKLINLVQSLFPAHAKCDDNQRALTRLPHIKQIFTTNYDSYIEDAYADKCHVIREEKDLVDCDSNVVQIYKLHGDFVNKDAIVITQSDYNAFFDGNKNSLIWAPLKLAMMNSYVLFIGYSLDDSNIFNLLQRTNDLCNDSSREMYLIAPTTEEYKANRLKKYNIRWIKSTAEDFLLELEQNIKDNIFADFRHNNVSNKTFIDFCHIHKFNPAIQNNVSNNEVVQVQGYLGAKMDRRINLTTLYNPFQNSVWEKIKPFNEDGVLKGKYGITIPVSDIVSFESRINGLKEFDKSDISKVCIFLQTQKKAVRISIPSRNFIATSECEIRQVGNNTYKCIFNFDICEFNLTVEKDPETNRIIAGNVHIDTKDIYTNQENAMRWVEVIDALASGELVFFPELEGVQAQISTIQENPFVLYKDYYKMVQAIEMKSNVYFSKYYNPTRSRYIDALKLFYWLSEQEITHQLPEGDDEITFVFHNEIDSNELLKIPSSQKFSLVIDHDISPIIFNDYKFAIPYDYIYIENCFIKNVEIQPNGDTKLIVNTPSKTYQEILTSTRKFQGMVNQNIITVTIHNLKE